MKHHFTAVFRKEGNWWAAFVEELPGAHSQGRTLKEARKNLKEAAAMVIEFNREKARKRGGSQDEVVREDLVVTSA